MADRVSQFPPIGLIFFCFLPFFEDLQVKKRYYKFYGGGITGKLSEFVCKCEVVQHDLDAGRVLILCNARRYCEWYPYNFLESMKQRICPNRSVKSFKVLDIVKCRFHEKKFLTDRLTHVFESYVSMKAHSLERVTSRDLIPYSQLYEEQGRKRRRLMTERGVPDAVLKSGIMSGPNSVMRIEGPGGIGLRKGMVKLHMDLSRDTQQSLRFNRVNQEVLLTYHLDATLVEKTIIPWLTTTALRQGLDPLRSASFGPKRTLIAFHATSPGELDGVVDELGNVCPRSPLWRVQYHPPSQEDAHHDAVEIAHHHRALRLERARRAGGEVVDVYASIVCNPWKARKAQLLESLQFEELHPTHDMTDRNKDEIAARLEMLRLNNQTMIGMERLMFVAFPNTTTSNANGEYNLQDGSDEEEGGVTRSRSEVAVGNYSIEISKPTGVGRRGFRSECDVHVRFSVASNSIWSRASRRDNVYMTGWRVSSRTDVSQLAVFNSTYLQGHV